MKWFLIIVLICVIMLIAMGVSEQYKDKFDFYNNLRNFLNQFKLNLSFKQEKISEFLKNTSSKKYFKQFVEAYENYLVTNEIDLSTIKILEADEAKELETIVKDIGKHDAKNEISQLNAFLVTINEKLEKAQSDKNKLCPMILKLSLLFAIGLAIILI